MKETQLRGPNGEVLLRRLLVAEAFGERLRGLIGWERVPDDTGLLIPRCVSVHTLFMRCRIDVVFLSGDLRVLEIVRALPPSKWARCRAPAARHTLETREGRIDELGIRMDETLVAGP